MKASTRKQVERLLQTATEDARDLLLELGYGPEADEEARDLFFKHFPLATGVEKEVLEALNNLCSIDVKKRQSASKYIDRKARGNWTTTNKHWLADPRTIDQILPAAKDSDPKVREMAISALGHISRRYGYHDHRILASLLEQFEHANDRDRIEIIAAIPQFGGKEVLETIYQGFECRQSKRKASAMGFAIGAYADKLFNSTKLRERFLDGILNELKFCKNADDVDNWIAAAAALKIESSARNLLDVLPKKYHAKVAEWHRRVGLYV